MGGLEIFMSFSTFIFEMLLIIIGGHQSQYIFATSALVLSFMTLYGVQQSYVARGRSTGGLSRRALYYFFTEDRTERWHTPTRMEIVRFLYSLLAIGTAAFDFFRIVEGWGVLPGFTAFPAAFVSVVFMTSIIDRSFGP